MKYKVILGQNYYCNTVRWSSFVKGLLPLGTPTFTTEELHLVSNVQLVKHLYCEIID